MGSVKDKWARDRKYHRCLGLYRWKVVANYGRVGDCPVTQARSLLLAEV